MLSWTGLWRIWDSGLARLGGSCVGLIRGSRVLVEEAVGVDSLLDLDWAIMELV